MSLALLAAIGLRHPAAAGETLTVAAWHIPTGPRMPAQHAEAITALKAAKPDVILVQGVQGWQVCQQFAKALLPENYTLGLCSSFRDPATGKAGDRQVAILCKTKPYFYWSEPWQSGAGSLGGFGFVALQHGRHRLALFSILAEGSTETAGSSANVSFTQLLDQIDTLKHWVTNGVQSFVLSAALNPESSAPSSGEMLARFAEKGFADTAVDQPTDARVRPGNGRYLLCDQGALALKTQVSEAAAPGVEVAVYSIELDPAAIDRMRAERTRMKSQAASPEKPAIRAQSPSPDALRNAPAPTKQPPAGQESRGSLASGIALALAGLLAGAATVLLVSRRRNRPRAHRLALLPPAGKEPSDSSLAYTVVVAPRSTTGSASEPAPRSLPAQPIVQVETDEMARTHSAAWQERALAAEARAEQATRIVRQGLMPQLNRWLREKLMRRLLADRAALLQTQQSTAEAAQGVAERLARIEQQVQRQNESYQQRILELSQELLAAKSENRELIQARINQLRAEMQTARAKALRQAQLSEPPAKE